MDVVKERVPLKIIKEHLIAGRPENDHENPVSCDECTSSQVKNTRKTVYNRSCATSHRAQNILGGQ